MATYSITAANVKTVNAPNTVLAAEAISAGQWVYLDDGKARVANNSTAAKSVVHGMALNSASADQPVAIATSGEYEVGSVFTAAGKVLALADTGDAGKSYDVADLSSGDYVTLLGWSTAANKLLIKIAASGVQFP